MVLDGGDGAVWVRMHVGKLPFAPTPMLYTMYGQMSTPHITDSQTTTDTQYPPLPHSLRSAKRGPSLYNHMDST